jgi:hypothetical protein
MDFGLFYKPGWDPLGIREVRGRLLRPSSVALQLSYRVEGAIEEMVVPEPTARVRTNNLWRTTCFEAFLKAEGSESYVELNFSPSGAWAAYEFASYRSGMAQAAVIAEPEIAVSGGRDWFGLDVSLALDLRAPAYRLGVAAIVEERPGRISYWAVDHPAERADFHHPSCFALQLPPPACP